VLLSYCILGCSECPDDQSCGCTYFTTHALVHGGWSGGYEGTCATLWSNFKAGKYANWKYVSKTEADVQEGFAVIMNNGNDGDASHCCVGTGKGKVSCHNPGHKDVPPSTTWYSGGGINAIWGWADDINNYFGVTTTSDDADAGAGGVGANYTAGTDVSSSCSPYESDSCNCVYYARDRQPLLPGGCSSCDDKKHVSNSQKAAPGCVSDLINSSLSPPLSTYLPACLLASLCV
jgi:hypothetical protein